MNKKTKIVTPYEGFQENFSRSNVDVAFGGGGLGGGKTFTAMLATCQWSLIPEFRGMMIRKNLDDLLAGGGLVDTGTSIYNIGNGKNNGEANSTIKKSGHPRLELPSGARLDFTHMKGKWDCCYAM